MEALEVENLIEAAEASMVSAAARHETRGAHIVEDYADTPNFRTAATLSIESLPRGSDFLSMARPAISDHDLGRLRWRCRRGLLENDLILNRLFTRFQNEITSETAHDLLDLMEFDDRDLLDLLLGRHSLPAGAMSGGKKRLLDQLRSRP